MPLYPPGYILWEGASLLTGGPIVVVATLRTENRKTGPMVQTWILCRDVAPHIAVKTGQAVDVCGSCALIGTVCYVLTFQAPLNVWKGYHTGRYPKITTLNGIRGRLVRFGAYGDPLAAPLRVWQYLADISRGYTGYTHQWTRKGAHPYRRLMMASTETEGDTRLAQSLGWRTFRVRIPGSHSLQSETVCPTDTHTGVDCASCLLCNPSRRAKSIVIDAHGKGTARFVTEYTEGISHGN